MKITKKKLKQIIKETIEEQQEGGLVNINAGPQHVLQVVPKLLSNPKLKDIIRSGQTDAAGPGDEVIEIRADTRIASKLSPTQSQIGADQSLNDQASDEDFGGGDPTNLDRAIRGGKLASKGGEFPILVFKNWVLDGHHRWSQFVATNPGATVNVAEIVAPGVRDEKTALALLHYMNFALFGKSPTKDFKGTNLYTMNAQQIKDQALKNMSEDTPKKLFAAKLIAEPTAEAAANHFANNLSKINGPGKYPRLVMPQPGDSGSKDGYATTPEDAKAGAVNYIAPSPQDLKEGTKKMKITREELNKIIQEEAGVIVSEAYGKRGFFDRMLGAPNKDVKRILNNFDDAIMSALRNPDETTPRWRYDALVKAHRIYQREMKDIEDIKDISKQQAEMIALTMDSYAKAEKRQIDRMDSDERYRAEEEASKRKAERVAREKEWHAAELRHQAAANLPVSDTHGRGKDKDVDWDLSRHEGKFTKADLKRLVKETIKGLNK